MSSKKNNYLGVDLGTTSIKVVELEEVKKMPKLVTYGYADQLFSWMQNDDPAELSRAAATLKAIVQQARVGATKAMAALPSFAVFSSVVNLPAMSKKDLEAAIQWEAKKIIPLPLEEVILDYKILDQKGQVGDNFTSVTTAPTVESAPLVKDGKNIRVLLTAAPKKLVSKYLQLFKAAGLNLVGLETESFSMGRSLVGHDPASVMVLDLGSNTSDIVIFEGGVPVLSRSVNYGGENITAAIAASSGLNHQQAEQFKMDLAASSTEFSPQIKEILNAIINEIKYSVELYTNQAQRKIDKIVLTGGSSFLSNLPQYLEGQLGIRVFIGDPWARVMYPTETKPLLDEIGPRFAVAIGAAMREI